MYADAQREVLVQFFDQTKRSHNVEALINHGSVEGSL